jgi:hypothetical protein
MSLEQNPINSEFNSVKDRISTSSVAQIADFFDEIVQREHLIDPKLGAYDLLKIAASNLPLKIHDNLRQKALEAIVSEDEKVKLIGKKAFQFLSLNTALTVVDSSFDKERDTDEDRDEMLNSAMISVIKNAPDINQKFGISGQTYFLAQQGVFSYLCEKYDISLNLNSKLVRKGTSLVREIAELKSEGNLLNKDIRTFVQEWSKETEVSADDLKNYLTRDQRIAYMRINKDEVYENIELEDLRNKLGNVLDTLLLGPQDERHQRKSRRQIKVLKLKYGFEDGIERTNEEVGREFMITGEAVRQIISKQALPRLRHHSRTKLLKGYH